MEMPPGFSWQRIFEAYAMAFVSAIRRLSPQEREEEQNKKKKKKKNKKKSKKVEEPLESQEKVEHIPEHEIHEAPVECEMEARNAILRAPSQEEKEKVEHVKENATEFTEEEIYEMLKQCNMDTDLSIQRLLSLGGFEKVKSKRTKKKERFNAQESKSQHEVGSSSSSSVLIQGESVDDDAGRTDTTHDNTVQGLQEADSNPRSQLDNVSSPLAATVSSVASQLPSSTREKGKGKKIVQSSDDDTAVISRSRVPSLLAAGPQRIHASRAGSNPRSSGKNVAGSSKNDCRKFPTTLGGSLTTRNGEFTGERSIGGLRTYATVLMPSDPEEQLTPHTRACEAPADAFYPNSGGSGTLECELLPTSNDPRIDAEESKTQDKVGSSTSSIVKQGENCDDDAGRTDTTHDNTVHGLQEADGDRISQLDNVSTPSASGVSSVASQLHGPSIGRGKVKEVVQSMDDTAAISRSHISPLPARSLLRLHASRAGSDHRASRNTSYSGNDSVMLPTALGGSSTTRNVTRSELSGERSIRGPSTHATLPMPPKLEKKEIPHMDACEAPADARNYNFGSSGTSECKLLPTLSEQSGPSEDSLSNSTPPFSHPSTEPEYLRSATLDDPPAPSRMSEHALSEASPSNLLRCSVQSIQNDSPDLPSSLFHHIDAPSVPRMYSSMEQPAMTSVKIHAEVSKTQHESGSSSSSIVKQGENCDDDAGRTDTTHDNTVHGLHEADSNRISQLDNVSSPSAAAVSSVASQLHDPNIGKEVVRSVDDNTAAIPRSHVPPSHVVGLPRLNASRAGSDPRESRNNVASSSRNDWGMLPTALWDVTGYEFSGERSIWGPWTHATSLMPPEPEKQEIPRQYACEALADAHNYNPGRLRTSECELLPTSRELHGPPYTSQHDCVSQWAARLLEDHPPESPSRDTPSVRPQFELPEISMLESGPSEDTPINSATSFSHLLRQPEGLCSPTLDAPPAPSRMSQHASSEPGPTLRCSIQSIQNDSPDLPSSPFHHIDTTMYSSMMRPAMMSANAPPFAPSSSVHQSSQTLLQGNNLSTGRGFTHPYMEPCYYQPQLALQYNYMNHDGQQDVYQGGILSLANAGPNSWESFPDAQGTLPNSPALSDTSWTQQVSALHLQAQNRNYCPYGMNFTARYNQPDPRAMPTLPRQQQGGLPGWVPPPSDHNNQCGHMPSAQQEEYQGGSSSWASGNASGWGSFQDTGRTCYQSPLIPPHSPAPFSIPWTSNGFTVHAQDQHRIDHYPLINPGAAMTPHGSFPRSALLPANANNWHGDEGSSPVNGNTSGQGSFQSPPIPPYSPAPPNDPWTSNESTLHAHYQYRNVHRPLINPGLATTPHGSLPRMALLHANANNQHRSEGSSLQYDSQGWLSQQRPQTRNRPSHQQQSPYSKTTGNLQDPSSMQPP